MHPTVYADLRSAVHSAGFTFDETEACMTAMHRLPSGSAEKLLHLFQHYPKRAGDICAFVSQKVDVTSPPIQKNPFV